MRELFQIRDYIKIASASFIEEFRNKRIHFEKPSRDVRFWHKHYDSHDGELFRRWLSGETLTIESNCLTVELPKDLAGNAEEIQRMVDSVFGCEGVEQMVLPTPVELMGNYHLEVRVIPDSARYTVSGRCVTIQFSTQVRFCGQVSRLTTQELERGICCSSLYGEIVFRSIHEILLNPQGVEFFRTGLVLGSCDNYIISSSDNERVRRRKFQLMYGSHFEIHESSLLSAARNFQIVREKYLFVKSPYGFAPYRHHSGYRIDDFLEQDCSAKECIEYYSSLGKTLEECVRLMDTYDGREKREFELNFQGGMVTLFLDKRESDGPVFPKMKDEILLRIEYSKEILQFLQEKLQLDEKSKKPVADSLLDWAFKNVLLDPISYAEERGVFRDFALTLV